MSIKDPAGWGTTWGGSKQCVTSLGKKQERFQWNQHVSASALGGINKNEEKWWHRATGEFVYSCAFALRASWYNDSVKKGKTKKSNFWPDCEFLTQRPHPNTMKQPPDSSRERGNARAKKDCKVKQEKLSRAEASQFRECWTTQSAQTFCGRKSPRRRELESFA